jgi:hypothetical protein
MKASSTHRLLPFKTFGETAAFDLEVEVSCKRGRGRWTMADHSRAIRARQTAAPIDAKLGTFGSIVKRCEVAFLYDRGCAPSFTVAPMASREPGRMLAFAPFQGFIREMSVYISSIYNDAVEGLDEGAARRLIEELTAFSSQLEYMYRHVWEPHDVLMWDNRCTVHAVTLHYPNKRRVMHRTTIVGREPVLAG